MSQGKRTPEFAASTAKGVLPSAVTKTGTIDSSGTVVTGTGTAFLSEVKQGDYLYSDDNSEVRQVTYISTDTRLEVNRAWGTNLSGEDVQVVQPASLIEVSLANTHASVDVLISTKDFDNVALPASASLGYRNDPGGLDPIAFDATGSSLLYATL